MTIKNEGQEYHFCTCGKSISQPSCDGLHLGTPFTPRVMIPDKDEEALFCVCKHSRNLLFCDGAHNQFSGEQVGMEGPGIASQESEAPTPRATKEEPNRPFVIRKNLAWVPAVLRYNLVPTRILVEVCNMNNPEDVHLLVTADYRQKMAASLLSAIKAYVAPDWEQAARA